MYPDAWLGNAKLKRCTHAEKGMWIDVICLMHDGEPYGVLYWTLEELARAISATVDQLKELVRKDILKGSDTGEICDPLVYIPRSGRKNGKPVILIEKQTGPIWFSSRMVVDEYKRVVREASLSASSARRNGAAPMGRNGAAPMGRNGATPMNGNGVAQGVHLSEDEDEDEDEDRDAGEADRVVGLTKRVRDRG